MNSSTSSSTDKEEEVKEVIEGTVMSDDQRTKASKMKFRMLTIQYMETMTTEIKRGLCIWQIIVIIEPEYNHRIENYWNTI